MQFVKIEFFKLLYAVVKVAFLTVKIIASFDNINTIEYEIGGHL